MANSLRFVQDVHPHVAARAVEGPVKTDDHRPAGDSFLHRFNAKVGLKITVAVGTMWCAYIFAVIALFSLPSTIASGSLFEMVVWISSSFLQLVLLPIIIVGQNVQARAADKRAEQTYNDAEAVLHEASEIQRHLQEQDDKILAILDRLEKSQ